MTEYDEIDLTKQGPKSTPSTKSTRVDELLAAHDRAVTRSSQFDPPGTFAAIAGISIPGRELPVGDRFTIRKLTERPQIQGSQLTRSLPVMHELHFQVPREVSGEQWTMEVLWTVIALLRASSAGYFVITEISNRSWGISDALSSDEVTTRPLNLSIPPWFDHKPPVEIDSLMADWVAKHWFDVLSLRKNQAAHFMIECLETSFGELDPRMSVTKVWAGIEAFIGASTELRFRLSTLLAATLEPPGNSRFSLYKRLQKLYDIRSRVVHGSALEKSKVEDHLEEARTILSQLVRFVVDRGSMPSMESLERLLLDPEGHPTH